MRILITGGGGFVAHHLIDHLLKTTDWEIVTFERRYSKAGLMRMEEIGALIHPRVQRETVNITRAEVYPRVENIDYIVHLAGSSSIAKSIANPGEAVECDVMGTSAMLQFARTFPNLKKFLYFSTDEVFDVQSPYSATKLAAEYLCIANARTYGTPIVITNCMNLIGERQAPDKFLPTIVRAALNGTKVKLHIADDGTYPVKDFLHAKDVASAIVYLLSTATEVTRFPITRIIGIPTRHLVAMASCAMDTLIDMESVGGFSAKRLLPPFENIGWYPSDLESSVRSTVQWMADPKNRHWLEA